MVCLQPPVSLSCVLMGLVVPMVKPVCWPVRGAMVSWTAQTTAMRTTAPVCLQLLINALCKVYWLYLKMFWAATYCSIRFKMSRCQSICSASKLYPRFAHSSCHLRPAVVVWHQLGTKWWLLCTYALTLFKHPCTHSMYCHDAHAIMCAIQAGSMIELFFLLVNK